LTRRLLPKQLAFVEEYMKCHNAYRAQVAAGYSKTSVIGRRLIRVDTVKAEIERRTKLLSQKNELTVQSIIDRLNGLADTCLHTGDSAGANRSLELLGRTFGMFIDKHEVKTEGKLIIKRSQEKYAKPS